ncbi:MAG: O-antigen ligase family protein [bacterium]
MNKISASTESVLRNIIIGGLFLVPFLPFIVTGSMFFPFITGKNFAFRIIIEIIFSIWAILAVFDKSLIPKKNNLLLAVGSFVGIIAIADILGVNFYRSFWSNYERMEGLVSLLHIFAYFILLISVFTESLWRKYFKAIFISGIGLMVYGAIQLMGWANINQGGVRLDATFGNTIYFAVHMLFICFLSALFLFRNKIGNNAKTWFYGLMSLFSAFFLLETATRGTAIGLLLGIVTAALIVFYKSTGQHKEIAKYVMGSVVALLVIFLFARNLSFVKESPILGRYAELSISSVFNQPRYMVWNMAFKGFLENPILGWGQDNFNVVFNKYYDPRMYAQEPWFDRAHDVFFDWLIAGGLLGLLSYLSIFAVALFFIWDEKITRRFTLVDRSVITGLLVGYFVHNIFVFDNLMSYAMFFAIIAYIYNETRYQDGDVKLEDKGERKVEPFLEEEFAAYVAISLVIVGFFGTMYFVNVKPILASKTLIQALSTRSSSVNDMNQSLDMFKKVFSYGSFGTTEAREQLVQRAISMSRAQDIDNSIKQNFFLLARDEMEKQIAANPLDARYRVFQSSLFSAYGLVSEAMKNIEIARDLSPKKQTILFELVAANINKGDIETALSIAKNAYDLEPTFAESRNIYTIAAIYAGKNDVVVELLGTSTPPVEDRFINAYVATKQYKKVAEIWLKRIEMDPKNAQYHVYLSATYLADKQKEKSIEELKKAIELNPALKDQATKFIKDIRAGKVPQ